MVGVNLLPCIQGSPLFELLVDLLLCTRSCHQCLTTKLLDPEHINFVPQLYRMCLLKEIMRTRWELWHAHLVLDSQHSELLVLLRTALLVQFDSKCFHYLSCGPKQIILLRLLLLG